MLKFTEEKIFTQEQVQQLFLSVHWVSGNYPEHLFKALMHSSTVLTVWDDEKLVGLTRVLDDTAMLAQIHYVLVHPDYQGQGIAGKMIEYIKEKYKDFLYIEGMPEDKNNVPFYAETCTYINNLKKAGIEASLDVYHSNMHAFDMMKPQLAISRQAAFAFNRHFEYAMGHYFAENFGDF